MKKHLTLLLIVIVAVSLVGIAGVVSAGRPTTTTPQPLKAPRLVSPADGATLPASAETTFTWDPVKGANTYYVYYEWKEAYLGTWSGGGNIGGPGTDQTSFTFPYAWNKNIQVRWWVVAEDREQYGSRVSVDNHSGLNEWHYFTTV